MMDGWYRITQIWEKSGKQEVYKGGGGTRKNAVRVFEETRKWFENCIVESGEDFYVVKYTDEINVTVKLEKCN